MKIGITGSLSSGKSTVAQMLSKGLGPMFLVQILKLKSFIHLSCLKKSIKKI